VLNELREDVRYSLRNWFRAAGFTVTVRNRTQTSQNQQHTKNLIVNHGVSSARAISSSLRIDPPAIRIRRKAPEINHLYFSNPRLLRAGCLGGGTKTGRSVDRLLNSNLSHRAARSPLYNAFRKWPRNSLPRPALRPNP